MSMIIDGTNGATFPDSSLQAAASSPYVLKNRIINGAMVIDQRNAGAAQSPITSGNFVVDRFKAEFSQSGKLNAQQNAGSVTPPTGFTNYAGLTSTSAYTVGASDYFLFEQFIEGYNTADLAWGTANAKTVTLSFWVRSSLTGTFGGVISNDVANRVYAFSYTISSANTWEQKTITITGDTSGTWNTTTSSGIQIRWSLGTGTSFTVAAGSWGSSGLGVTGQTNVVATNAATWYITGVQLEIGSTATPFERRMYGQELANCQRYFYKIGGTDTNEIMGNGIFQSTTNAEFIINMPVTMRTAPTASYSGTLSNFRINSSATFTPTTLTFDVFGLNTLRASCTVSGATAGYGGYLRSSTNASQTINVSAEL